VRVEAPGSVLIEDSTLHGDTDNTGDCNSSLGPATGHTGVTVRRTEFRGCENGVFLRPGGPVLIEDSWMHDLDTSGDAHTDGVQIAEHVTDVRIRHNTIAPRDDVFSRGATSAFITYNATSGVGQNHRVWIEDNLLDGANASYTGYAPRQPTNDFYINRNRMVRGVNGYITGVRLSA
jgi:nitrous oxidase accessory protein NosD